MIAPHARVTPAWFFCGQSAVRSDGRWRFATRILRAGRDPDSEEKHEPVSDIDTVESQNGSGPYSGAHSCEIFHLCNMPRITLALLRALARRKGPLALVHFDTHVDTWPDNFGQSYRWFGILSRYRGTPRPAQRMIQIGIRSPVQRHVFD
jgi:agmatinase